MSHRALTWEQEEKYAHWIRNGDMTQAQAAERAGVSDSTICAILKRHPEREEVMSMR
ncbi:MAG: hypothetical protein KGN80_00125 [Acidobacteriota bacterium]|nr:hypothetical protein [Acidobacteriota bacterium]